jgi:hypothetical protein
VTLVWRVSFAVAGVTGILATVILVPEVAASGALSVAKFLRLGALPLYALITFIAVTPGLLSSTSGKLSALQVEAILFCLVVFLAAQVAWAAAMSTTDPAQQAEQTSPATRNESGRPLSPPPGPVPGLADTRRDAGVPRSGLSVGSRRPGQRERCTGPSPRPARPPRPQRCTPMSCSQWTAGPDAGQLAGITALELDADGLITAITSVYDSRQIDPAGKRALLAASFA